MMLPTNRTYIILIFIFIYKQLICNYIRFPLYIAHSITNIYHKDETSERSVFLFSMVCSKAVLSGGCLGVPLRVGLSAASPRYAVGFSL